MRMLLEMRYRRTGEFIYTKDEICSIFQTDNVEQILARSPYLLNIQFELIVFWASKDLQVPLSTSLYHSVKTNSVIYHSKMLYHVGM